MGNKADKPVIVKRSKDKGENKEARLNGDENTSKMETKEEQTTSGTNSSDSNFKRSKRIPWSYHAVMDAYHQGEMSAHMLTDYVNI